MKSELLATSPLLVLPLLAFFLFLVVFLTVFCVTMARKAMAYDPIARLPFEQDDEPPDERSRRSTVASHSPREADEKTDGDKS